MTTTLTITTALALPPTDDETWMEQGVCAQVDPEIFFPEKGGSTQAAKAVCEACPVQAPCLAYALTNRQRFGIWGGLTEKERHRLERDQAAL